jgi:hypothetical protein
MKHNSKYQEVDMSISITPDQAVERYGINRGTLANLRLAKKGPSYLKVGRKVLYKVSDFEAWLFREKVQTTESIREVK